MPVSPRRKKKKKHAFNAVRRNWTGESCVELCSLRPHCKHRVLSVNDDNRQGGHVTGPALYLEQRTVSPAAGHPVLIAAPLL
jgi:hypothetical protein